MEGQLRPLKTMNGRSARLFHDWSGVERSAGDTNRIALGEKVDWRDGRR
jgi:hypothetical protein